ncbi:MAG TPA: CBS domain-containing protein [Candidatus Binatia bacterium]|nr:CBS domain-containing protein [Candidatus Binatia bacterium]
MTQEMKTTVTVRDLMARDPATLGRNETLDLAESIMNLGRIRHMPVVDDGRIVGIVSQRDLFRSALITALGFGRKTTSALIKTITIKEIMTEHVITIPPEASVKEAARVMIDKKIGCLPVVEDQKLIGLLTETDILRYVVES